MRTLTDKFQSPHGDSFFSDATVLVTGGRQYNHGFNPLTGIRSFLTKRVKGWIGSLESGFNPLTGIRSFLTQHESIRPSAYTGRTVSIPSRGFVLF